MQKKYHYNPKTGETGICKAKYKCDFDLPQSEHFTTEAEASAAYNRRLSNFQVRTISSNSRPRAKKTLLSSIMNLELLKKMDEEGFVAVNEHPDDPSLKVLCYGKKVQFTGTWNEVTKQARGLVIRSTEDDFSDAVIVERPWAKFFTLSQMSPDANGNVWALGDEEEGAANSARNAMENIDFNAPAEVTDKVDGSMLVLYTAPDGKLAFTTKGNFQSEQAQAYTKMIRNNEKMYAAAEKLKKDNPNTTFVFEGVGPENQIVLEYDKEDIVLLGAINKDDGKYLSTDDFADTWSEEKGLSVTQHMPAKNLSEALALPPRQNAEGVVVRIMADDPSQQMQIKIKQEDYLILHRSMSKISVKDMRNKLFEAKPSEKNILELAEKEDSMALPEVKELFKDFSDFKEDSFKGRIFAGRKKKLDDVLIPAAKNYAQVKKNVDSMPDSIFQGEEREVKKNFALALKERNVQKKEFGMYMELFKAKYTGTQPSSSFFSNLVRNAAKNLRGDTSE